MEFFARLFDTTDFPARWSCGRWSSAHGWLHILADLGVWTAYLAIPLVLVYFVRRRGDLPFRRIFVLFGAFILLCGTTHLMEALIFWWPAYRLAGVIKLLTAVVSWATVFALVRVTPMVLAMRSPEELENEIKARRDADLALHEANAGLERRVAERTAELDRANAALLEERELFRTTLASIGDAVIATDTENRVTFMNPVAETLTGWGLADALAKPLEDIFHIVREITREPIENPARRALASGRITGLGHHTILLDKQGGERPIDKIAAPIRVEGGETRGAVLVFRDVSDRRVHENELRESRERLAFALEAADLGQWEMNLRDHTAQRTPRHDRIFGYDEPLPEWTFAMFLDHVVPDDRERADKAFRQSVASGTPYDIECRVRRADGSERHIWTKARLWQNSGGLAERMAGIVGDNTERRQMEDDLRRLAADLSEADRRKDEFLATLAHELRNPLAPISNGLQVLRMAGGLPPPAERARGMMDRQLAQMVRLVDDLLDVSRITRNKVELRRERIDLAAVLRNAVELSRPSIDAAEHRLDVTLPPVPVTLDADPTRLAQVFSNLLNNAAKYTNRGGSITLTADVSDEDAVVTVTDTGVGLAPDMLRKVFGLFVQADTSLEKAQGGLGIGLTLVQRLVEMHGGTVEARSDGMGRGCSFVVRLPARAEVSGEPAGQPAAPEPVPTTRPAGTRILVADDNVDSANSLRMLLELQGYEVSVAHDGQEAVERVATFDPDVIILDIGMPRMNGYEVCRRIRRLPGGGARVIVACTGWGQEDDRRKAAEAGFDHHLVKPVEAGELAKILAGAARRPS